MNGGFDFDKFRQALFKNDKWLAFSCVTPENILAMDEYGNAIVTVYCLHTTQDDVEDLLRYIQSGCPIRGGAFKNACDRNLVRILHDLIVLDYRSIPSGMCAPNETCASVIVETMIQIGQLKQLNFLNRWWRADSVTKYIQHRDSMQSCAIHTMHAMYEMGRKDVGRIIARVIWASRSVTF